MAAIAGRPSGRAATHVPLLLRLYPAAWRARYGDEFADLLLARPPSLRDRIDILRGAVDARLHPQVASVSTREASLPRDRSAGGLIVIAGALLTAWAGLGVVFMGRWDTVDAPAQGMQGVAFMSGFVGSIVLAGALLLIASRYDWSIGSSGAIGGVLTGAGLVFSSLGGGVAALLLLGGGTMLLAWRMRTRLVGTVTAAALVVATLLVIGAFIAVFANGWTDPTPLFVLLAYGPAWMLFGLDLRAPARQTQLAGA